MGYYKLKGLCIKKGGITTITIADSNTRPIYYRTVKLNSLQGLDKRDVLKKIAIDVREGYYQIVSTNNKTLNKIYEAANYLFEKKYSRFLMDEDYACFVADYVLDKTNAILEFERKKDNFYTIEYAKRTVIEDADRWAYLPTHQENEDLARFYVINCAGNTFFHFPTCLLKDKDMVLYAVRQYGVNYRLVYKIWNNDEEVTLAAFSSSKYPEHLPDLIGEKLLSDKNFLKRIIIAEPKLHWERFPKNIKEDPQIKLWLLQYNVWYQGSVRRGEVA